MSVTGRLRPVDVVLIDLNEVLTGIVAGILESDPDVRIAATRQSDGSLDAAVGALPVDVAIVAGETADLGGPLRDLLCRRPRLRALAVGGDGAETVLYELRPHRTELGELSPPALLRAVKAVGDDGCAGAATWGVG
jgi:hypothetical protein